MNVHIFRSAEYAVKCPDMLFALEPRHDFDYQLAIDVLNEILAVANDFTYTKKVYYAPYS